MWPLENFLRQSWTAWTLFKPLLAEAVVTFAELRSRASAVKQALEDKDWSQGHTQCTGQRKIVAVACGNSLMAEICAILGVILSGGCFVPLNETLPKPRLVEILDDARPVVVIHSWTLSPAGSAGARSSVLAIVEALRSRGCVSVELDGNGNVTSSRATGGVGRCQTNGDPRQRPTSQPPPRISSRFADSAAFSMSVDKDTTCGSDTQEVSRVDDGASLLLEHSNPGSSEKRWLAETRAPAGVQQYRPAAHHQDDEDLLYILYTSGTTDLPKGVRGTRSGALNRIRFGWTRFPFRGEGELVARRTPSCFVDFVAEVLAPLLAGVPLALLPDGAAADPLRLVPALADARVTRITLTPSLLSLILRTTATLAGPLLPDLHTWLVSGEALHPDLALCFRQRTAPGVQLVNLYGSTEVAGDATYCTLDEIVDAAQSYSGVANDSLVTHCGGVLIGNPLPGVHLSVVDPDLVAVAAGVAGELLVGGVGVALGYNDRPRKTADKFLLSARHTDGREGQGSVAIAGLEPGRRVFRTGDRVIQPDADGPLFWLSRLDDEVKVRGMRVSLHDVETLACKAAGLPAGSFAVAYDPGGADVDAHSRGSATNAPDRGRLVAFFLPSQARHASEPGLRELKAELAAEMGLAQLPSLLVPIEGHFPLTTSGKVDRKALLRVFWNRQPKACTEGTASSDAEDIVREALGSATRPDIATEAVANAVTAVLPDSRAAVAEWLKRGVENLGSQQSLAFTEMGGTSLLAVEAAWRASRAVVIPATLSPQASSTLLAAADFLRGTLSEVASTLHRRMQSATSEQATKPLDKSPVAAHGRARPHQSASPNTGSSRTFSAKESTLPADATSGSGYPLPGRKRRRESRVENRRPWSFLAIGRAGAGLRHSLACLGVLGHSAEDRDAVVASVGFQILWRSSLSKCIDATPLVVVPEHRVRPLPLEPEKKSSSIASIACLCDVDPGTPVGPTAEAGMQGTRDATGGHRDGTVYIGSHSGEFKALDLVTGELKWSFVAGDRLESGAACSDDGSTVFVGCHDRKLYALDRHEGTLSWSLATGDVVKCTPVCVPSRDVHNAVDGQATGTVLIGSYDGILRCLSQTDGKTHWVFDCGGALFASPTHDADARVIYAATTKGRLVALDSATLTPASTTCESVASAGTTGANGAEHRPALLWEQTLPAPCFSSPAMCDGVLVVGCVDGGLFCFSSSGERLWVSRQAAKPVFSSPCLLPYRSKWETGCTGGKYTEPHIVWGCHDGRLRCQRGFGAAAWETDIDRARPVFASPCFAAVACEACSFSCPLIFACSVSGRIAALRASDGVVVGETNLPGEVFSSPVVVGRRLLVGCRDNHVYAVGITAKCSRCT